MGQQWSAYDSSFQSRHSHAQRFNKMNEMTEVKLMISELIPLFLSVVSSGEQTTHNIQFSAAHGSDMSERLFPTHIYFFTLWYETWWKYALLKLSLPLDFSAVSRLHRNWRHSVRYRYSYYWGLWSIFSWNHVENMSISLKGYNPLFSEIKLLFSSQCICRNWYWPRNKAESSTNSVTEAMCYRYGCQFHAS